MSAFLTVLSVIGAVIGGITALILIVFLVLLPIKAEIDTGYNKDDGFFIRVKYFAFSYGIIPRQERKPKKKKKKDGTEDTVRPESVPDERGAQPEKKTEKKEKQTKESLISRKVKQLGMSDYLTLLGFVKEMLGKIRFGDLCINLIFGTDDAAKTAMFYGTATSAVFPLIGKIHNEKKADYIDVHINADFTSKKTFADVYAEIYLRTVHAVALLFKALVYILKKKENENGK